MSIQPWNFICSSLESGETKPYHECKSLFDLSEQKKSFWLNKAHNGELIFYSTLHDIEHKKCPLAPIFASFASGIIDQPQLCLGQGSLITIDEKILWTMVLAKEQMIIHSIHNPVLVHEVMDIFLKTFLPPFVIVIKYKKIILIFCRW